MFFGICALQMLIAEAMAVMTVEPPDLDPGENRFAPYGQDPDNPPLEAFRPHVLALADSTAVLRYNHIQVDSASPEATPQGMKSV